MSYLQLKHKVDHPTTGGGGGGLLNKVSYGEAPPRGSNSYPLILTFTQIALLSYHLRIKITPLSFITGITQTVKYPTVAAFLSGISVALGEI